MITERYPSTGNLSETSNLIVAKLHLLHVCQIYKLLKREDTMVDSTEVSACWPIFKWSHCNLFGDRYT